MKKLKVTVNGRAYDVVVEEVGEASTKDVAPKSTENRANQGKKANTAEGEPVKAPMPGTILSVNVGPGKRVAKGEVLAILEAMKMENEIPAPRDAEIVGVNVKKGDSVESGADLFYLK